MIIDSSESVMPGHPDKLADQVSDALLDAYLASNKSARVAIETLVTSDKIVVAGETDTDIEQEKIQAIIREVIKDVGYTDGKFNYKDIAIETLINAQSQELNTLVKSADNMMAGDQSILFGYAVNENDSYIPSSAFYANSIMQGIWSDIRSSALPHLGPDGKILVNLKYSRDIPVGLDSLILSLQHKRDIDLKKLRLLLLSYLQEYFPSGWLTNDNFYFNTSGSFTKGGPESDTGLTGRKIMVDICGGGVPSGGGAFSGKDGSKIDRSAAYMARYLAKNIVASGLASKCLVKLVYFIGLVQPTLFKIDTFGTALIPEGEIIKKVSSLVDLSPSAIFNFLDLGRPIYRNTAAFGHFGRQDCQFAWEEVSMADDLVQLQNV